MAAMHNEDIVALKKHYERVGKSLDCLLDKYPEQTEEIYEIINDNEVGLRNKIQTKLKESWSGIIEINEKTYKYFVELFMCEFTARICDCLDAALAKGSIKSSKVAREKLGKDTRETSMRTTRDVLLSLFTYELGRPGAGPFRVALLSSLVTLFESGDAKKAFATFESAIGPYARNGPKDDTDAFDFGKLVKVIFLNLVETLSPDDTELSFAEKVAYYLKLTEPEAHLSPYRIAQALRECFLNAGQPRSI